jgi:hypothetical protein
VITAVSAYVPIPGHPRPEVEYERLGRHLMEIGIPMMLVPNATLEDCWLFQYLAWRKHKFTHSVADNPVKNSIAYHIVQAQKSEWLADASVLAPDADVLVWMDYGIFGVPGVTGEVIRQFLIRANEEKVIAIPGCWDKNYTYDDNHPCWRFCGGVIVMPKQYAVPFDQAMKREYFDWLQRTNNLSWEVNTMARLERHNTELPIWHYYADHNATMFTAYQAGGRQALLH